jgi:hypothetical protein
MCWNSFKPEEHSMNERQRRAITWETIERIAFQPKDQASWLQIYGRSLGPFWRVQAADVVLEINGFEAGFLNLACQYQVEALHEYNVRIINAASDRKYSWSLEVDPAYCSKASLVGPQQSYPRQDMGKHLQADVKAVLEGMLFHPRAHCHGEDIEMTLSLTDGALSAHEVRLGGGIENAFTFLTHLRYQFCLVSEDVRKAEKTRLVDLFTTAISEKRSVVPAANLFDFRR